MTANIHASRAQRLSEQRTSPSLLRTLQTLVYQIPAQKAQKTRSSPSKGAFTLRNCSLSASLMLIRSHAFIWDQCSVYLFLRFHLVQVTVEGLYLFMHCIPFPILPPPFRHPVSPLLAYFIFGHLVGVVILILRIDKHSKLGRFISHSTTLPSVNAKWDPVAAARNSLATTT